MFKGARPPGQPRTARSIAEDKNLSSNFSNVVPGESAGYTDAADKSKPTNHGTAKTATDPTPFQNLR